MTTIHFTYKGGGLLWPGLPQIAMLTILSFNGINAFTTGAPPVALFMFFAITSFIIIMFNFSFPKSFTLAPEGMSVHTSLGTTIFVPWSKVVTIRQSGPSFVIKAAANHWSAKIINKYMAFTPLLIQGEKFKQVIKEQIRQASS